MCIRDRTIPGNPNPIPQGYGSFWDNWIQISDNVLSNYSESNVKTLIVQGDDDLNVPVTDADEFETISNTEVKIYEGINHFLTSNSNNTVSTEILTDITEWINSCVTTSTEDLGKSESQINIYRSENEIIIESDEDCANCQIKIYTIDGKLINSKPMFSKYESIPSKNSNIQMVVQVIGRQLNFSKIVN